MFKEASNINHLWAGLLVEELVRCGVTCFGLSPGSRSTPLTLAVAQNNRAKSVTHFDERAAAFQALGWAKACGRPAALVCTSGTAAANYWPAVVEASTSRVPLILLTADRPPELRDCAANQAIAQPHLYGDYVRWHVDMPCPDMALSPTLVLTTAAQAAYRAARAPAGPVHLNCMFREPLAPMPTGEDFGPYLAPLQDWMGSGRPYTTWHAPPSGVSQEVLQELLADIAGTDEGLLVVGQLGSREEARAVEALAHALGWPVFPDVGSGLRLGTSGAPFVHHYGPLLLSEAFRARCRPGFVLHLGGGITSKRLQQHLAGLRPEYVLVADHPFRQDPAHQVTRRIESDVTAFCEALSPALGERSPVACAAGWSAASQAVSKQIDAWLEQSGKLTEIHVARLASRVCTKADVLFLGNSMPIRDMDAYGAGEAEALWVAANRGASGIDGNIATAAGYANALERPVVAVLGDLAVLHDLNALALLRQTAAPVLVIVVNNDGGGIFSFLPVAAYPETFEAYFGTPHGLCFSDAARFFGLHYAQPETPAAFEGALRKAVEDRRPALIEVSTRRSENFQAHRELDAAIESVVREHYP